jgi:hypothetical protein
VGTSSRSAMPRRCAISMKLRAYPMIRPGSWMA